MDILFIGIDILRGIFMLSPKYFKKRKFLWPLLFFHIVILGFSTTEIHIAKSDTILKASQSAGFPYPETPKYSWFEFLHFYFDPQLKSDYYVPLGQSLSLNVQGKHPFFYPFPSIEYSWGMSEDGFHWKKINQSKNTSSLKVDTNKVGDFKYQVKSDFFYISKSIGSINSKVATVHVVPNPIPTLSLTISTDSNYLLNHNSDFLPTTTKAFGMQTPKNATGKIKWSTDDPKLATIDSNGKITANKNNKPGTVKITGTIDDADNSSERISRKDKQNQPKSASTNIKIGGGLDEKTVNVNQTATFNLELGQFLKDNITNGNFTVDWFYRDNSTNTVKSIPSSKNQTFIQISNPDLKNNQNKYFAKININKKIITIKDKKIEKTFKTNEATLTVLLSKEPKVDISTKILNQTYQDQQDTDQQLTNIATGDKITYQIALNNISVADFPNSNLDLPLLPNTNINYIKLDDIQVPSEDYSIGQIDGTLHLKINSIPSTKERKIEISTITPNISRKTSFDSTINFSGKTTKDESYSNRSQQLHFDYTTNKIGLKFKNIFFEQIQISNNSLFSPLKYRLKQNNAPENIVDVDDQRRNKRPVSIFLNQSEPLQTNDKKILNSDLRFYQKENYQNILNTQVLVTKSQKDQPLKSIKWDKEEGLLLYLKERTPKQGNYSATLNWIIKDSI